MRVHGRAFDSFHRHADGVVIEVCNQVLHDPFTFVGTLLRLFVDERDAGLSPGASSNALFVDLDARKVVVWGGGDWSREEAGARDELRCSALRLAARLHASAATESARFSIGFGGRIPPESWDELSEAGAAVVDSSHSDGGAWDPERLLAYLRTSVRDVRANAWTRRLLGPWHCACGFVVSYADEPPWEEAATPESVIVKRIGESAACWRGMLAPRGTGMPEFSAMAHECGEASNSFASTLETEFVPTSLARMEARFGLEPGRHDTPQASEDSVNRLFRLVGELRRRGSIEVDAARDDIALLAKLLGLPVAALDLPQE